MQSGKVVPNPDMTTSFERTVLPVANRKNMGVIAMKVFAQDALLQRTPSEKLLRYSGLLAVAFRNPANQAPRR
jgi:hypothetical protein